MTNACGMQLTCGAIMLLSACPGICFINEWMA